VLLQSTREPEGNPHLVLLQSTREPEGNGQFEK
jgi:hypothetical protein